MVVRSAAGYSGTPLAKKPGFKAGSRVMLLGAPEGYERLIEPLPAGVVFERRRGPGVDIAHIFVTREVALPLGFVDVKICAVSDSLVGP